MPILKKKISSLPRSFEGFILLQEGCSDHPNMAFTFSEILGHPFCGPRLLCIYKSQSLQTLHIHTYIFFRNTSTINVKNWRKKCGGYRTWQTNDSLERSSAGSAFFTAGSLQVARKRSAWSEGYNQRLYFWLVGMGATVGLSRLRNISDLNMAVQCNSFANSNFIVTKPFWTNQTVASFGSGKHDSMLL